MENLSLLVQTDKNFNIEKLKTKLAELGFNSSENVLLVDYHDLLKNTINDFLIYSISENEDENLTHLLNSIKTDNFMFFNLTIDYPKDFFEGLERSNSNIIDFETKGIWITSLIALQQSSYGLCAKNSNSLEVNYNFLRESVIYNKQEVLKLNTDKLNVHSEMASELYNYTEKKKLNLIRYSPKIKKRIYLTHFADVIMACQKQAQIEFKFFPAFFVLFFLIFGIGAAFHPLFLIVFLVGMSAYMLAITLEAFGLSTIKKNGGLVPVLLLLFPFIHLVYGLESWFARFKTKT